MAHITYMYNLQNTSQTCCKMLKICLIALEFSEPRVTWLMANVMVRAAVSVLNLYILLDIFSTFRLSSFTY